MIGTTLSHYRITAKLGEGGMGEVYRAHDERLDRDVAIKVLPEEVAQDEARLARFEREAKLLASLNHTNIATLYGLEEHEGQSFLVMELAEGETLAEVIKKGPIPIDDALPIALQISEGLEAAHEQGMRYMVVPTAASVDGYAAFGASITKNAYKQTIDCPAPHVIVADTDVLQTSLEEFKNYLIDKIDKLTQAAKKPAAEDDIVRIYLQCDQRDLDATAILEEYLFDQGFEVKLTAFEGDETQVFEAHKDNLLLSSYAAYL